VDSVAQGDVELGNLPVSDNVAIGGSVKCIFVMLDMVVEPSDLFLKVVHFDSSLCFTLGNGGKEPISDGSEDAQVELRMGSQGCHNSTRQHRWFWTLNWSDRERDRVLSG
jgi:hypothetical protein